MNPHRMIVLAAVTLAFAASARAQTCSGGADGGMDATGNQCASPIATTPGGGAVALLQPADAGALRRAAIAAPVLARTTQRSARIAAAGRGTPAPASAIAPAPAPGGAMTVGVTVR